MFVTEDDDFVFEIDASIEKVNYVKHSVTFHFDYNWDENKKNTI